MSHPCSDCEEEIECVCPCTSPPCSACTDHVCYEVYDAERLEEIQGHIAEAQQRPAWAKMKPVEMLIDLEWLCERLEILSGR